MLWFCFVDIVAKTQDVCHDSNDSGQVRCDGGSAPDKVIPFSLKLPLEVMTSSSSARLDVSSWLTSPVMQSSPEEFNWRLDIGLWRYQILDVVHVLLGCHWSESHRWAFWLLSRGVSLMDWVHLPKCSVATNNVMGQASRCWTSCWRHCVNRLYG